MPPERPATLEQVIHDEGPGLLGSLARRLGDLDLAEDLLQEAYVEALEHWPSEGLPPNPAGWLATTARRKAVDRLRRETAYAGKLALVANTPPAESSDDDRLALVFACCHPALPDEARIALTLRTVCGLTTWEIASAFLVPEATMAQRLSRAKRLLRRSGVRFEIPDPDDLAPRLDAVLAVVYLVYNEGYLASAAHVPERRDLRHEALALARLLADLMPSEPEAAGLTALLELHEARVPTRFDDWGRLVLLEDQDRSRWDRAAIAAAAARLDKAMTRGRAGPYQVQAAIAALHAQAPAYDRTDWHQIRLLYDRLAVLTGSPVVRLNRAVATWHIDGAAAALAEVDGLANELEAYHLFHATRGQLLAALGRSDAARTANERALALATNPAERELLARRLAETSQLGRIGRTSTDPVR